MSTLTQLFTSIANAIRTKKGTSELIEAEDFPTEIASITSGVMTQEEYDQALLISGEILGTTLPYTKLEYIESSGTQYIDTGINGGENASYEFWFNPLTTRFSQWEQYFAGDKVSSIAKIYLNNNNIKAQYSNSPEVDIALLSNNLYKVSYHNDGKIFVNDTQMYQFNSSGNGWGTLSWYVFNSHGESNLKSTMRLYKLQMYKGNELVRDFIPVKRNLDNVVCLYDKASRQFFTNAGTGSFIAGPEINS